MENQQRLFEISEDFILTLRQLVNGGCFTAVPHGAVKEVEKKLMSLNEIINPPELKTE